MSTTDSAVPRLGIAYISGFAPERLRHAVHTAEAAGLDEFWLWEDSFAHGGLTTAAVALASSKRMAVGIGLLPAPLRNVALTAMELASLHRLFPGRLIAGVGHGVQEWMGQVGARLDSPMTLLMEYYDVLRRLLDGETVTVEGRYLHMDHAALRWPPEERVPLMLGGEGPKTLRLAARTGDGTLLTSALTEAEIGQVCDLVRDERANASHRSPGDHQVVALLLAATGAGARQRVDDEAARWNRPSTQKIGVSGDADDIAAAVLRLADGGVTSVAVEPTEDEPDLPGFIEFLATEVKPRLASAVGAAPVTP